MKIGERWVHLSRLPLLCLFYVLVFGVSMQSNNMLESALSYYDLGYAVVPLKEGTKDAPLTTFKEFQHERPTREMVIGWWNKWPSANIAILTGKVSNLCVVDLDKYKPDYSEEIAIQYFPDDIITPMSVSPRGGNHLYFKWPGFEINGKAAHGGLKGIDFRCDNNYIMVPPSSNGDGKEYSWLYDLRTQETVRLPDAYINKIKSTLYAGNASRELQDVTGVTSCDIWSNGVRDENLFHVANCLVKTKNDKEYIRQTLRAIMSSWGERDERWTDAKIQSALDRSARKERNIQAEVDAYISVTDGNFSVTETNIALQCVTKEEKAAVRIALHRRKDKTIEKIGFKDGIYRRIDTEVSHIDFAEDEGASSSVILPLELSEIVCICEGNIILISGEFNAGKTTFALNCLQMNKNRIKIRYISSEMRSGEFKARWRTFGIEESWWMPDEMTEYVELKNNLPKLILPDDLNIIDYLEFKDGDYTQGAEYMRQIHDRLRKGVAIVCNQQKKGALLPRSGDLIMEKPRLAVTMRKVDTGNDEVIGIAEIQKAKNVKVGKADGKRLKYQLMDRGSRFKVLNNWGYWKI